MYLTIVLQVAKTGVAWGWGFEGLHAAHASACCYHTFYVHYLFRLAL